MQKANASWSKNRPNEKLFVVDNDVLSPIVHELGHYKPYMHVSHHATANGITYSESKRRFNEKLLVFLDKKGYNLGDDISGYAREHLESNLIRLEMTNEVISESTVLFTLKGKGKAKAIVELLEKEDW